MKQNYLKKERERSLEFIFVFNQMLDVLVLDFHLTPTVSMLMSLRVHFCLFLESQVLFTILTFHSPCFYRSAQKNKARLLILPVCRVCKQLAEAAAPVREEKYVDVSEHALLDPPHTYNAQLFTC